jgi:magnesium transporter
VLLVYWTAHVTPNGLAVELVEVHLHISGGYLFTVRRARFPELDELRDALSPEDAHAEDYIVYRVLDVLTDALFPVVEHLETRIDELEEQVLSDTDRRQLGEIYRLKQEVTSIQRKIVPQRDQFGVALAAILELPGLTRSAHEYLRDIGDHLAQVAGELHRQSEDLAALTSTYFSANQNRLNLLATRLTVLATFFLIWTLVTSFFGQNFRWLTRHIASFETFAIYETLGLVLPTVLAAIYFWRRRREWL